MAHMSTFVSGLYKLQIKNYHSENNGKAQDKDSTTAPTDTVPAQSILKDLKTQSKFDAHMEGVTAMNGSLPIQGFKGIFGIDSTNDQVFEKTLPTLDTVMKGGTVSLFCYGYTGAGKTHTTLGYGEEHGVFHLASNDIFQCISQYNKEILDSNNHHETKEPYMVLVSVMEVYDDDIYDLLGERAKCTLRKNKRGQLLVRGATEKKVLTEKEAVKNMDLISVSLPRLYQLYQFNPLRI